MPPLTTNRRLMRRIKWWIDLLTGRDPIPELGSEELEILKQVSLSSALRVMNDDLKMGAFAFAGTLLGLVRGGKLIEHDDDIDLAISECAWLNYLDRTDTTALHGAMGAAGFELRRVRGDETRFRETGIEFSYTNHGLTLDLFVLVYDAGTGKHWNSVWYKKGWNRLERRMRKHYHRYVGTTTIHALCMDIPVPSNAEEWLSDHYGHDWRSVKKEWNYLTDPGNIGTHETRHKIKLRDWFFR